MMVSCGEVEMAWCMTSVNLSFLYVKDVECDEEKIGVQERSLLQSGVSRIQGYSVEESADTFTLFPTDVAEQAFREFLGYVSKRSKGSYVEETPMPVSRVDTPVATLIHCSAEKDNRGAHRRKENADTYKRMVKNATKELIGNIKEFEKHWS